jgi:hydroxymethylpyrimidine pyrophosphatase-like HAD family hydrolase
MNKLIAVDFDGTIVTHAYPRIGKEIPYAIETLKQLQRDGYRLVLWTVRSGKLLDEAVEFCLSKGLEFYAVNANYPEEEMSDKDSRKVNANIYIDDRNVGGLPDWGVIYQIIQGTCVPQYYTQYEIPQPKGFFARLKQSIFG